LASAWLVTVGSTAEKTKYFRPVGRGDGREVVSATVRLVWFGSVICTEGRNVNESILDCYLLALDAHQVFGQGTMNASEDRVEQDAILISEGAEMGFGNQVVNQFTRNYSIHYVRVCGTKKFGQLLRGRTFGELGKEAIIDWGTIPPPDGTPTEAIGWPAITSFDDALEIAKAARANPESVVRVLGFSEQTPIYFVMAGQPAELHG